MKVWVVEFREEIESSPNIDTVLAFVASTKEKAVEYILANKDFDEGENWWWAVYYQVVDSEEEHCGDLTFYTIDGIASDCQPPKESV